MDNKAISLDGYTKDYQAGYNRALGQINTEIKVLKAQLAEAVEKVEFLHERHRILAGYGMTHISEWLKTLEKKEGE